VKDENKRWRASDCMERLKCALRYITSFVSEAQCVDYFQTKKKGETLYGELLINGKPQKTIAPSVFPKVYYFSLLLHSGLR
jgi:hypothetical protein